MAKPFTLGKGLSSLIPKKNITDDSVKISTPSFNKDESGETIRQVAPADIVVNPEQPRQQFDHTSLEDLVSSIKIHGILQPLVVSPLPNGKWQLIAGERRLRASKILNLKTVPVIARATSQQQQLELSLVENIQRQNLNPIEEARAYQRLHDEFNLTQEQIAEQVGKSRPQIANMIRLLELPDVIQQAVEQGTITLGHAKVILSLENKEEQEKFFRSVLRDGLTVRETAWGAKKSKIKHLNTQAAHSAELKVWEDQLRSSLGTKVKIKQQGRIIKIELECYSTDELRAITEKLIQS